MGRTRTRSGGFECPPRASAFLAAGGFGAALLGAAPALFRERPPPAHTGGFGEPTCQVCHAEAALNEPSGELSLEGVPAAYAPGRRYLLRVVVHRPGLAAAGFQLAVRFAQGETAGRQAGALRARDSLVHVAADSAASAVAIQYAQHTFAGTRPAADTGRWTLEWTAPPGAGGSAIVFHVVANAANDDASPLGDFIYATSRATRARAPR